MGGCLVARPLRNRPRHLVVTTWKIVAAALLIFAAGVMTGGLTAGAAIRRAGTLPPRPSPASAAGTSARPEALLGTAARPSTNRLPASLFAVQRLETFRRIGNQLDLDSGQRTRIESQIGESTERLRSLWGPMAMLLQQEVRELRKRIAVELTPEQRERFAALLEKRAMPSAAVAKTNAPTPADTGR